MMTSSRWPSNTAPIWICIQSKAEKEDSPDFLRHDADLGQVQRDNFREAVKVVVKRSCGTMPEFAHPEPAADNSLLW